MERSIWTKTCALPEFMPLRGEKKVDVLVIGGGIAGILTACFLQQRGISCALVEKGRICSGITANTTAKITVQHGLIYHQILNDSGLKAAKQYYIANQKALLQYESLSKRIPCDFERQSSYIYTKTEAKLLEAELYALEQIGCPSEYTAAHELPFKNMGAVKVPNQAQFHPLKLLSALTKELNIYEQTQVISVTGNYALTTHGGIIAKKIVFATHFPMLNRYGCYFLKLYQHRSYIAALLPKKENAPKLCGMFADNSLTGFSFRQYGDYLLISGGGHRTGKRGGGIESLSGFIKKHYPDTETVCTWGAQDCMSLDGIPYIGQYSKLTPDYYVLTGFGKWGMTTAMAGAMLIADLICTGKSEYAAVFNPSRRILKPQLAVNAMESAENLLFPSRRRCTHLGCALKWNAAEHSWDCACHGSRFSADGKVLDNPANRDRNVPYKSRIIR